MSDYPRFEDTPEYRAVMDAHRQQLLAAMEAAWHRIAETPIADLLDASFEVSKGLTDLSYDFCIQGYQVAIRQWAYQQEQGERVRQMALIPLDDEPGARELA